MTEHHCRFTIDDARDIVVLKSGDKFGQPASDDPGDTEMID